VGQGGQFLGREAGLIKEVPAECSAKSRSAPASCPSWVNRVTLAVGWPLPVHPKQQTFLAFIGMFQRCHVRKSLAPELRGSIRRAVEAS
jgi:hypothetical protein